MKNDEESFEELEIFWLENRGVCVVWYHLICRRYFRIYIGFGLGDRGHTGAGGFLVPSV